MSRLQPRVTSQTSCLPPLAPGLNPALCQAMAGDILCDTIMVETVEMLVSDLSVRHQLHVDQQQYGCQQEHSFEDKAGQTDRNPVASEKVQTNFRKQGAGKQ